MEVTWRFSSASSDEHVLNAHKPSPDMVALKLMRRYGKIGPALQEHTLAYVMVRSRAKTLSSDVIWLKKQVNARCCG